MTIAIFPTIARYEMKIPEYFKAAFILVIIKFIPLILILAFFLGSVVACLWYAQWFPLIYVFCSTSLTYFICLVMIKQFDKLEKNQAEKLKALQDSVQYDPETDAAGNISLAAGKKDIRILNLFAYTGAQTLACSAHGADEVVHVDASKGMIAWAKENIKLSGLEGNYVRFIAEDCMKFVEREIRRGRKYDGIIMDPPSYGRGPKGELWQLEDSFYDLVKLCTNVLSDDPLFFIASSYATGITAQASGQIFKLAIPDGKVEAEELMLPVSKMGVLLPCGQTARWTSR
jgi:16S rRNA G966 N2-methylase RsmD